MFDFFEAAGCTPACHICNGDIEAGDKFRLKEYVKPSCRVQKDGTEVSAKIMICGGCDKKNRKLPRSEVHVVLREGMMSHELDWRLIARKILPSPNYSTRQYPYHGGCFVIDGKIIPNQKA